MTSPWKKLEQIEPVNLQDIMSEQVAIDLQAKENKLYGAFFGSSTGNEATGGPSNVDEATGLYSPTVDEATGVVYPEDAVCQSDAVIAALLQKQYDKEFDKELKVKENNYNKINGNKVSVSFNNYRRSCGNDSDEEEEEIIDVLDRKDWDRFDDVERSVSAIPRCGYKKNEDGGMVTKHDMTLSGRKNACKFMSSFPPEFHTGDGAGFDLKISNKVFNSLRTYSNREQSHRRHKIRDKREDQATAQVDMDEFTRLILYKMINNQMLERVNGIISTGKEAVILHADCDPNYTEAVLPKECVIKMFKTTLSEFKQRDKYIKDDHRFKDRYGSKQNSRSMVALWAEKEMANLSRLQKIGIPCPQVIALKKHVLVMSFIGSNHRAAPKLKDVHLKPVDWIIAHDQVIDAMKKMYTDAKLVHADLSEYNILWHEDQCWFIDVGQSVEPTHPNAFHFLIRDCTNISGFFTKRGVPEVKDARNLFIDITGCDYYDRTSLPAFDTIKPKPHHIDDDLDQVNTFDFDWENSQAKKIVDESARLQLVDTPAS